MKKILLFSLLSFFLWTNIYAQQAEQIVSIVKKPHDLAYFSQQAELWWNEIQSDKQNENAWWNFYLANRYARMMAMNQQQKLDEKAAYIKADSTINKLMEAHIPNSFTYHYTIWKQGGLNIINQEHLFKAYELNPDFPGICEDILTLSETKWERDKRKKYNKLRAPNEFSPGILAYNYNMMMTADTNAIILSMGDNDTYPQWYLQDVKNIRTDIQVINLGLILIEKYREMFFKELGIPILPSDSLYKKGVHPQTIIIKHLLDYASEKYPVYLSLTIWKNFYQEYNDQLFIVGLALKYSEENIDNIALLKKNLEENYLLDYIKMDLQDDQSQFLVNRTNVNYLPGLIKLYTHYKIAGDKAGMQGAKNLAMLIIAKSGDKKWAEEAQEIFKD